MKEVKIEETKIVEKRHKGKQYPEDRYDANLKDNDQDDRSLGEDARDA